jgi:tRNA A37 threonylcarbamoyladenosine synthetase subunit TsaC/SUA5/YrdC
LIYLVQTDTTVGLLSSDQRALSDAKQRDQSKKTLQAVDSLKTLQTLQRVPNRFKKKVRNSQKTTFVYPSGDAFRVVSSGEHHHFLNKFGVLYSTSANITNHEFDFEVASTMCDVIVFRKDDFSSSSASAIVKINNTSLQKIR